MGMCGAGAAAAQHQLRAWLTIRNDEKFVAFGPIPSEGSRQRTGSRVTTPVYSFAFRNQVEMCFYNFASVFRGPKTYNVDITSYRY